MEHPGGGFLLARAPSVSWALTEDARALGQAARTFVRRRVLPANAALEAKQPGVLRDLLREAGEAGLLGAEVPREHGGLGAPPDAAAAIVSGLGYSGSFAVTCAAHLTIGAVPLLRHAREELRRELLPEIVRGARVGAYALTEAESGSDALSLRTRAVRADDGGFRLSGSKQFVSNAAIADQFVVFALDESSGLAAFLVDAKSPGLSLGAEEDKLGLRGSSTCALALDDVYVPVTHVLGTVGLGHRVAIEALTVGRHKLGLLVAGHLELLVEAGVAYALDRRQFGRPIGELALVGDMIASSVARAYALEAVVARAAPHCAPDVVDLTGSLVEAAICKVSGAEAACAVADAMLQLHGGIGYLAGSWVEQSYRDVRVNRIYEGTDEINRRAIAGGLARAMRRGRLDLAATASDAEHALRSGAAASDSAGLAAHALRLAQVALAASRDSEALEPIEGALADLAIAAYVADSAARRARDRSGAADHALHEAAAVLAASDAVERAHAAYGTVCATIGGELPTRALSLLDVAPRLRRPELRRAIADAALGAGRNPLVAYDAIRPPPC